MDRINTASKAVDLFGVGKHGWKNRNVATGVEPTDFNAEWCNGVQEEEMAIIEGAGIVPDAAVRTQVRQAIKRMTGSNVTTVNFAASPFALTADHAGMVLVDATGGNVVINLPAANVLAGLPYAFRRVDTTANTVTVNRAGADTIDEGGVSFALTSKAVQQARSNGVATWSTVTPVAATQAETNAGTDDSRFVTALKLRFGLAIALAVNGYIKLPACLGGLIIQFGASVSTNVIGVDNSLTFPMSFPNGLLQFLVVNGDMATQPNGICGCVVGGSTSSVGKWRANTAGSFRANFIAIGY